MMHGQKKYQVMMSSANIKHYWSDTAFHHARVTLVELRT